TTAQTASSPLCTTAASLDRSAIRSALPSERLMILPVCPPIGWIATRTGSVASTATRLACVSAEADRASASRSGIRRGEESVWKGIAGQASGRSPRPASGVATLSFQDAIVAVAGGSERLIASCRVRGGKPFHRGPLCYAALVVWSDTSA